MSRKFPCSGLAMLIAASTLAENFEQEKAAFVAESPYYSDPYIVNYKTAIDLILTTVFGIDVKGGQKTATRQVNHIALNSKEDLGMVRDQIARGFRNDPDTRDSLLDALGFTSAWESASKNNQEGVLALLLKFRNNLGPEARAAMEAKGVSPVRIDHILANASALNKANIDQEALKSSSKEDTGQVNAQLNEIYDQAVDICKIGHRLFKGDELKQEKFVFKKILENQSTSAGEEYPEEESVG
ncbi:hypothetical protein [Mangrovibacterium lignilyticum]|uniref:hypothetical protein n=1 Tax=Mangrovibacterium lignilyticum TaxID=2668052 RepID=UPI0013D3B3C9|nr:hypothetical protein [Mangrovibacterium lignilyticum]